jgi:hypothetical protein
MNVVYLELFVEIDSASRFAIAAMALLSLLGTAMLMSRAWSATVEAARRNAAAGSPLSRPLPAALPLLRPEAMLRPAAVFVHACGSSRAPPCCFPHQLPPLTLRANVVSAFGVILPRC